MTARYVPLAIVLDIVRREGLGPVRDVGLLASALERPQTTLMGETEAYPTVETKAAALLHSLCTNHALVDGNKRISAIITLVFLRVNGYRADLDNDGLFDLIMDVASGELRDVPAIATRLHVTKRER